MSIYTGLGMSERIERIRRASQKIESARAAALAAESSSKEILDDARALLRAHKVNFGTDHLEIVDVIGRLLTELDQARTPAPPALPEPKPPARAKTPTRRGNQRYA